MGMVTKPLEVFFKQKSKLTFSGQYYRRYG